MLTSTVPESRPSPVLAVPNTVSAPLLLKISCAVIKIALVFSCNFFMSVNRVTSNIFLRITLIPKEFSKNCLVRKYFNIIFFPLEFLLFLEIMIN